MKQTSRPIWTSLRVPVRVVYLIFAAGVLIASSNSRLKIEGSIQPRPQRESPSSNKQPLARGASVSRIIAGNERHSFELQLISGEYVQFKIDKGDLNLKVSMAAPDSSTLLDIEALPRREQIFSLRPMVSGLHILTISSNEKEGYSGSYELSSLNGRAVDPRDDLRLSAERSLQNADRLRSAWTADSLRGALSNYEESGAYSRRAGDVEGQLLAKLGAADVLYYLSENRKALIKYREALRLSVRAKDSSLQIKALNGISLVLIDLGKLRASLPWSTRARNLSRKTGNQHGLAASLNSIGLQNYSTGSMVNAAAILYEALSLFQALHDRRGQSETLMNLGYTTEDLGDPIKALDLFQSSLALATEIGDERLRGLNLTVIGLVKSVLGEKTQALEFHNSSKAIFQKIGNRYGEGVVDNGIANVLSDLGQYEQSLEAYDEALQIFQEIGERDYESLTIGCIGNVYMEMGDADKALPRFKKRLELSTSIHSQWIAAHTLSDIGESYDQLGQSRIALRYFNQSLTRETALNDLRGQAYSLNAIGKANENLKDPRAALLNYSSALKFFQKVESGDGVVKALHNIVRVRTNLGDLDGAYDAAKSLIGLIEERRTKVFGREFRTSYFASAHIHYESYIDVLMRMHHRSPAAGYAALAFEENEKSRARGLLDALREAQSDVRNPVAADLLEQEQTLRNRLSFDAARLSGFLSGKPHPQEVKAVKAEMSKLASEYYNLQSKIQAANPRYAAITKPRALSLSEIQSQVLDADTMLLEYCLGDEHSYLWAATRDSSQFIDLPGKKTIRDLVESSRASISISPDDEPSPTRKQSEASKQQNPSALNKLSRLILGPVADQLGNKRLVIVADGPLQSVPFSALPDPSKKSSSSAESTPLIMNHEIVNVPSASVLAALRAEAANRTGASKTIAIFADPVFDAHYLRPNDESAENAQDRGPRTNRNRLKPRVGEKDGAFGPVYFAPLPFSRKEAEDIAQFVPAGDRLLFLGVQASKRAALSAALERCGILHFATHALVNSEQPGLSQIVLSQVDEKGQAVDGSLKLNEIYGMKLKANLAVLSACKTALGKESAGEGLLGLTRGFMYAGASRVIASLWSVDDEATKELMKNFYEGMLKQRMTAAQALRRAQMIIRDQPRWRAPYYWAGFVLHGDWR
ncbi:MAG: hypothetical protein DMF61_01265 [Blastocatellia bacterium AA13]|nr:MAG: hypothetical protein DMF61_01265 [Blastocatellia bacterium AA13]